MTFNLPYCPSLKYNFKSLYDQFGRKVRNTFTDQTELILIKNFEENVLRLLKADKQEFYMVELGCNQAYYSCLFYAMCLKHNKTPNVLLVEPNKDHYNRAVETITANKFFNTKWSKSIVGDIEEISLSLDNSTLPGGKNFLLNNSSSIVTLEELLKEQFKIDIDILHMDVDFSEWSVLSSSKDLFLNKNIDLIFISTHSEELHNKCKSFLLDAGYKLSFEEKRMIVGYDSLLIFNKSI